MTAATTIANFFGLALLALTAAAYAEPFVSVCERSPHVLLELEKETRKIHCWEVDQQSLERIRGLTITAYSGLKCGDFANMPNLERLTINYQFAVNGRVGFPECLFNGLSNLRHLRLNNHNGFFWRASTPLPKKIFSDLKNLITLELYSLDIDSLERDHFSSLTKLQLLVIYNTLIAVFPEDVFVDLTNLLTLIMRQNLNPSIPAGLFYPLINLTRIELGSTRLQFIPNYAFASQKKLRLLDFSLPGSHTPLTLTGKAALYGLGSEVRIEGLPADFNLDDALLDWSGE